MSQPLSVLIVDDSALMRKLIADIVASDPALCVAGHARDGKEALRLLETLRPDAITLDVEMPVMDGLAALEEIMRLRPTPTIMLSSQTHAGAETTLRCLERGALDFVGKPSGAISLNLHEIAAELIAKIKMTAGARLKPLLPAVVQKTTKAAPVQGRPQAQPPVLLIGASTGGPRALQTLLPALPSDLNIPIVIVQHMPAGFTASLATRLHAASSLNVHEAVLGEKLEPNVVLVAPGGRHLRFDDNHTVCLGDDSPVHGVRPSVDVTLGSLARTYGPNTIAVLLTGMGRDGARALKLIRDLGGRTFAEDESSCVVYGMPKAAVDIGGVETLLPLDRIAEGIVRAVRAQARTQTSSPRPTASVMTRSAF